MLSSQEQWNWIEAAVSSTLGVFSGMEVLQTFTVAAGYMDLGDTQCLWVLQLGFFEGGEVF